MKDNEIEAVLSLALEALEMVDQEDNDRDFLNPAQCYQLDKAITALRQVIDASTKLEQAQKQIAEQAPQEPVAWGVHDQIVLEKSLANYTSPPYMATPRQRPMECKPLTDEQIGEINNRYGFNFGFIGYARAIEAKLKEKNNEY